MGRLREGLRDFAFGLLVLLLLVGTASAYAQNWPPAVIVESGSMMHADQEVSYGRFGTIDPGDLVLVRDVDEPADVETLVENGPERYGLPGDVIVYRRAPGAGATPIIHRAIAYVEVVDGPQGREHRVRWDPDAACVGGARKESADPAWCVYGPDGVRLEDVPGAGAASIVPDASGFITKGDNPRTNGDTDQALGISQDAAGRPVLVPLERVEGKARGELPWVGLLKLVLSPSHNQPSAPTAWLRIGNASAPGDLWAMLALTLGLGLGGPAAWDVVRQRRARRSAR